MSSSSAPTSIVTSVIINAAISAFAFIVFGVFASAWPAAAHPRAVRYGIHARARAVHATVALDAAFAHRDDTTVPALLREPARSVFGLFWQVLWYPRRETLAVVGLDGVVILGLAELGAVFFTVLSIVGALLLIPLNQTNAGGDGSAGLAPLHDAAGALSVDHWGIANLSQGSAALWAHTAAVWLYSALLAGLLAHQWAFYAPLRYQFLANARASEARRSVLAVGLPAFLRTDKALVSAARDLYGAGEVEAACLLTKGDALAAAVAQREATILKLRELHAQWAAACAGGGSLGGGKGGRACGCGRGSRSRAVAPDAAGATASSRAAAAAVAPPPRDSPAAQALRPTVATQWHGFGPHVDAIGFYEARLAELTLEVQSLRETGLGTKAAARAQSRVRQLQSLPPLLQTPLPTEVSGRRDVAEAAAAALLAAPSDPSSPAAGTPASRSRTAEATEVEAAPLTPGLSSPAFSGSTRVPAAAGLPHDFDWEATLTARAAHRGVHAPASAGFITFHSLATAAAAPQLVTTTITGSSHALRVVPAPEPTDVLWSQAGLSNASRTVRGRVMLGIVIVITLSYSALLALISSLTSADSMSAIFPGLKTASGLVQVGEGGAKAHLSASSRCRPRNRSRTLTRCPHPSSSSLSPRQSLVLTYVPTVAVTVVVAVVPAIISALAAFSGVRSLSELSHTVVVYLHAFYVFNVLLVFSASGSVWGSVSTWAASPGSIVPSLAGALPALAQYFIAWMLLRTALVPIMLLVGLLLRALLLQLLRRGEQRPGQLRAMMEMLGLTGTMHLQVPVLLLAFTIALTYSAMNPIICGVAAGFFGLSHWAIKYTLLYAQQDFYQSGGALWPTIAWRLVFALLLFQAVMLGLLALKGGGGPSAALIPLLALTLLGALVLDGVYARPTTHLPVELAQRPALASLYALRPTQRASIRAAVVRRAHAALAVLAAADLLRAAMQRWRARKGGTAAPTSAAGGAPDAPQLQSLSSSSNPDSVDLAAAAFDSPYMRPCFMPSLDTPYDPLTAAAVAAAAAVSGAKEEKEEAAGRDVEAGVEAVAEADALTQPIERDARTAQSLQVLRSSQAPGAGGSGSIRAAAPGGDRARPWVKAAANVHAQQAERRRVVAARRAAEAAVLEPAGGGDAGPRPPLVGAAAGSSRVRQAVPWK